MPASTARKRKRSRITGGAALAVGAALMLTACGSTKDDASAGSGGSGKVGPRTESCRVPRRRPREPSTAP